MIVLVDQDGPLADFEGHFLKLWKSKFPDEPFVPIEQRRTFYIRDNYPGRLRSNIESIYSARGFYLNLPVIPGAVESLKKNKESRTRYLDLHFTTFRI